MGQKLPPEQLALYNRLDEILWDDWNPIGVSGEEARDEYYGYLPEVFHMVLERASLSQIAAYLHGRRAKEWVSNPLLTTTWPWRKRFITSKRYRDRRRRLNAD